VISVREQVIRSQQPLHAPPAILHHDRVMDDTQADRAQAQLRAGVYAWVSETYDAAELVPTQLERGTGHAARRGWAVVATFKDDGYSAYREITRDGFADLIRAIEAGQVDVVIVRDVDRLTRNLADWNAFEKACVRPGVLLSAYTGGDLDLSTAEAPIIALPYADLLSNALPLAPDLSSRLCATSRDCLARLSQRARTRLRADARARVRRDKP
jgi:hypothetical protein